MRQKIFIAAIALLVVLIVLLVVRYADDGARGDLAHVMPITRYTLSNGLEVRVIENNRTPVISHTIFVRTGGADDPVGKSGLAHYVEHMMFKGTKTVPEGEYDRRVAALGGENNAYTTADFTAYFVNAPVEALEQVMALESDRFMNLVVDDAEAATELSVIKEERHMRVESDPASQLDEQVQAVQYLSHPYRMPVIGWAHDIASFTPTDVRRFIAKHHSPSNMVLMVAGDVDPKEVRRLAMRYFGGMDARKAPPRIWASEPPAIAAKTVRLADARVQQPQWSRHYTAPSFGRDEPRDVVALELASQWLGGGRTGVLYQALVVAQDLAVDVSVGYSGTRRGPGEFVIAVTPKAGVSMATIESAVDAALSEALARGPDADAVARAKTLYTASITYAQDGLTPVASYIGGLMMIGKDEQLFYGLAELIAAVSDVQIKTVAADVLRPEHSVTAELLTAEGPRDAQ